MSFTRVQGKAWTEQDYHRLWLAEQARALLDTFQSPTVNPRGGFYDLDDAGAPLRETDGDAVRGLHATCRMVFCYTIGSLIGHPGSEGIVEHGLDYLWRRHRDAVHGGYFWRVNDAGPEDASKQAYGHAFVLLAAASAKRIGHPEADRLLADVTTVIRDRFWEAAHGAVAEEFTADWAPLGAPYRGQNSNMHLTEALMAAFEVTRDDVYLEMAERIADLLIHRITAANQWRLPEHFDAAWAIDRSYAGSEMFRPAGTTPGHWLEWSRLLVQLWMCGNRRHAWMTEAADQMFRRAVQEGWDPAGGGLFYTLDFGGRPLNRDKIWWPLCEGIGAAAFLSDIAGSDFYEHWYRKLWGFVATHVINRSSGRWIPQLGPDNAVKTTLFSGRPDLYHALQACLIPLYPRSGSLLAVTSPPPIDHGVLA